MSDPLSKTIWNEILAARRACLEDLSNAEFAMNEADEAAFAVIAKYCRGLADIERRFTHPTIDMEFYVWLRHPSSMEMVEWMRKQSPENWKGIAMLAWQRSRETLKTPFPAEEGKVIDILRHTEPEGWPVAEFMQEAWDQEEMNAAITQRFDELRAAAQRFVCEVGEDFAASLVVDCQKYTVTVKKEEDGKRQS